MPGQPRHKPTKQRERARAAHAATYQQGFNHGYELGLERGLQTAAKIRTVVGQQFTLSDAELERIVQGVRGCLV